MAIESKNILLTVKKDGEVLNLFPQTSAHNVIVDKESGETLKQRLLAIGKKLDNTDSSVADQVAEVKAQVTALLSDAPEAYDSLKEIADWIGSHQNEYQELKQLVAGIDEAINAKIGDLGEVSTVKEYVDAKDAELKNSVDANTESINTNKASIDEAKEALNAEVERAKKTEADLSDSIGKVFVLFESEDSFNADQFEGLGAILLADDPVEVATEEELVAASQGENSNIMLTADIDLSADIDLTGKKVDSDSYVINANGHTINI